MGLEAETCRRYTRAAVGKLRGLQSSAAQLGPAWPVIEEALADLNELDWELELEAASGEGLIVVLPPDVEEERCPPTVPTPAAGREDGSMSHRGRTPGSCSG